MRNTHFLFLKLFRFHILSSMRKFIKSAIAFKAIDSVFISNIFHAEKHVAHKVDFISIPKINTQ